MAWDHTLNIQTSHNIYLFMVSFSAKYAIYIVELKIIKTSAGRGVLLRQQQKIAVAIPLVKNKRKTQWPNTPIHCNSKLFYVSCPQDLLCIVCTIYILSTGIL